MPSTLKALADLIVSSVDQIDRACEKEGTTFPALDTPFTQESEKARNLAGVNDAIDIIVAAATQLIATARIPASSLSATALGWTQTACLGASEEGHIPEILRDAGAQGLHVNDIAKRNGMHPDRISRILRFLATAHIYNEVSPDVFTNNRISSLMDTGKPVEQLLKDPAAKHEGTEGFAAFVGGFADEFAKSGAHLPETLTDPKYGHSSHPHECALSKTFGNDINIFQWYDSPGNGHRMRRIGMVMHGVSKMLPPGAMLKGFDFAGLKDKAVVVDVGGGVGSVSLELAKAFPKLNFVIEDRPSEIGQADKFWKANYPEALDKGRVKFVAHDFFTPLPDSISKPDVFLLRMILHDWSDPYSAKILTHLRNGAGPDTKLVIVDHVLGYPCAPPESVKSIKGFENITPPPAPLLHNMGGASFNAYAFEIMMLTAQNGEERTVGKWQKLLQSTGWKLKEIKKTEGSGVFHPHIVCEPL